MFGKRKQSKLEPNSAPVEEFETDPETGLMTASRFEEAIEKEIARGLRYGSTSALVLFEVGVAEKAAAGPLPSPASFVAKTLLKAARTSDIVARVSTQVFAVLLVEARAEGAAQFSERVRTAVGSNPYARREDGSALFARAWAGVAQWDARFDSVSKYAHAAQEALDSTFVGYESAQAWYRGEGLNKPLTV
ncbi:MAG: GGDEF domain-containing protein [Dehalococcoidia bacterium]